MLKIRMLSNPCANISRTYTSESAKISSLRLQTSFIVFDIKASVLSLILRSWFIRIILIKAG